PGRAPSSRGRRRRRARGRGPRRRRPGTPGSPRPSRAPPPPTSVQPWRDPFELGQVQSQVQVADRRGRRPAQEVVQGRDERDVPTITRDRETTDEDLVSVARAPRRRNLLADTDEPLAAVA